MAEQIELGDTARDTISGFEGVAVARTEWLFGCRRMTLQPRALHDGKPIESQTFDEPQLELVKRARPAAPALAATGGPRPEPTRHATPARRA